MLHYKVVTTKVSLPACQAGQMKRTKDFTMTPTPSKVSCPDCIGILKDHRIL